MCSAVQLAVRVLTWDEARAATAGEFVCGLPFATRSFAVCAVVAIESPGGYDVVFPEPVYTAYPSQNAEQDTVRVCDCRADMHACVRACE